MRPNQHQIEFNVDGSFNGSVSSIGGFARNFNNKVILVFYEFAGDMAIWEAELYAM